MGFGIGVSNPGMGPRGALDHFSGGQDQRGQVFNRRVVIRLLAYLRPYTKQMAGAFLAMLGITGLTLLTPYLLKVAVDQYITLGDRVGLVRISLLTAAAFVGLVSLHRRPAVPAFVGGAARSGKPAQRADATTCSACRSAIMIPTSSE